MAEYILALLTVITTLLAIRFVEGPSFDEVKTVVFLTYVFVMINHFRGMKHG